MKKCLKCHKTYADDTLNYCLDDGTTLAFEGEEQTVVFQKTPPKKSKFLLWLGLFGLLFIGVIGLVFGYVFYTYFYKSNKDLSTKIDTKTNVSPSPTELPTPRINRTPPPANETSPSPSPTSNDTIDEITPISWTTSTAAFNGEDGQIFKFDCPPDGVAAAIWGSDIYTGDSSICTAAVHAGLITLEDGGRVTVELRPGRQLYGSTNRHGINSYTYGNYPRSFVVR